MNSDDLRYVLTLKQEGTYVAAGRHLQVSHTTVARRITAIESELGARLFEKTPQGQVPTIAGEKVLQVAQRVEEELLSLDRDVTGQDARLSGKLRITTLDTIAYHHVRDFTSFTERYPSVDLEVSVDNQTHGLTKREADIAIRLSNNPPIHLVGRKIAQTKYAIYGSRELVNSKSDPDDLLSYPWLSWCENEAAGLAERFLTKHAPGKKPALRVDSVLCMWNAVRAGAGISYLGTFWADQCPELVRLGAEPPTSPHDMWILTHEDLRHTARIQAFMEHFAATMRNFG